MNFVRSHNIAVNSEVPWMLLSLQKDYIEYCPKYFCLDKKSRNSKFPSFFSVLCCIGSKFLVFFFFMVHQCNAVHRSNGKIPIQISIGILSQGVVLHSCIVVSVCNSSKFSYQQSNIDNICLVLGLFPSCIRCAKDDLYRGPTCHFHVSLR